MNTLRRITSLVAFCYMAIIATSLKAQVTNKPQSFEALLGSRAFGPSPNHVSLFLGGGNKTSDGRKLAKELGVTPYNTNQVVTLDQLTKIAVAALKREGREVSLDLDLAANIELNSGQLTILVYTQQKESCFVSFDSSGRITRVGGAKGPHGEGGWQREYKIGQPVGQAK